MRGKFTITCLLAAFIGILLLGTTTFPRVTATDTLPQAFGPQLSVNDDANDVQEWVENQTTFAWGPAPAWASYCDILQVNASEDAQNYSIAVILASAANVSRLAAGFAGIRVFVNLTAVLNAPGTLELVVGGNLYPQGQVSGHLSYATLNNTNTSELFNVTDIATITGSVVNFTFPQTFLANVSSLPPLVTPLAQWSVIVWAWDFFNSTASFQDGQVFWDAYGDPGAEAAWGQGTYSGQAIGGYDAVVLAVATVVGMCIARRHFQATSNKATPAGARLNSAPKG